MTRIEIKSERKKKAIKLLVDNGEYSIAYAIMLAEQLNDEGKLLDDDYDELMKYLEELMIPKEDEEPEYELEPNIEENEESPITYE